VYYENYPKLIMLELTRKCNLKCVYCQKSKSTIESMDLTWNTFSKIKEHIKDIRNVCLCGMGEQFIHPHIYDIIEALHDKNIIIISNGTIKIDFDKLRTYDHIQNISFSVDGHNEETIRKNCSGYLFDNLIYNLEQLSNMDNINVSINYLINHNNIDTTLEMVDFCQKHSIQGFNMLIPSTDKEWIMENSSKVLTINKRLKETFREIGILYGEVGRKQCDYEDSVIPYISSEGDVRTCCCHTHYVPFVGNLKNKNYDELLLTKRYKKFTSGVFCEHCNDFDYLREHTR